MSDIVDLLRERASCHDAKDHALHAAAADEIERLRAGGCARNQRTTQFCAEAVDANARAERAEAQVAALREALREIAKQKKTDELDTEYDVEVADFEGGYDMCIDRARAALEDKG